jgi:hypothetical protein
MVNYLTKALVLTSVATLGWGTAFAENNTVKKMQTKVYDLMDKDITTIRFEKGSTNLTENEKNSLKAVVQAVRDDSDIEKVIVASWADENLPKSTDTKLSKEAKDLADKRNDNIKKVLKDLGAKDVETHSMAEQPTWIGKTFGTEDAQIKESLAGKNVKETEPKNIANVLENRGGASKAVVIVKRTSSYSH